MTMKVVISAGHGDKVPGAIGYIDEHKEACKVIETVAAGLRERGVEATTYIDKVSTTQNENLNRIVDFHNSQTRDLDVSVHFNAYETTSKPMGTEVLYVSQTGMEMADEVVDAICEAAGLINRGPKKRTDLFFLNNTNEPAILIETCFVDSKADVDIYHDQYAVICNAIAAAIAREDSGDIVPPEPEPPTDDALLQVNGSCSWFGGPDDDGVAPDEGLAFLYNVSDAPELFLPTQPPGTTGLARRLDGEAFYVACRWDYSVTSKDYLRDQTRKALVRANDKEFLAQPADWGPHEDTGRVADISPGLMEALGIETDDQVEVIYPAPDDIRPPGPEPEATVSITIEASGPVKVIVNGTPID